MFRDVNKYSNDNHSHLQIIKPITKPSADKHRRGICIALSAALCHAVPLNVAAQNRPLIKRGLALALGGGAARGFAHIGVIEVLEANGIRPEWVVGTSAGSLVGALYASGMSLPELRKLALELDESALGDWTITGRAPLKGESLERLVNRLLRNKVMENFDLKFAAVATDLFNGKAIYFSRGNPGQAVRASSAVPGVFEPVNIGGRDYVDGGLVAPIPVSAARALGALKVIAVDISAKPRFQATDSMTQVFLQTFAIMGQQLGSVEMAKADIAISPETGDLSATDFSQRNRMIEEGQRATTQLLPAIQRMLLSL